MEKRTFETMEAAVDYLYNMPRFTNKNTMEDTKRHLALLGSPDKNIPNIIHVAGTNGKGSTCAYMNSCLREMGKRVGVFTSPHLVDVRERFMINGEMISEELFLQLFLEIYESLDWNALQQGAGYHPTFFEYLFFMAMLYFARAGVDYCILETGLGGRLDATNSVSHKELCVITHISLDHVEYLGDTVSKIAAEKAGIMMQGIPTVYCDEVPEASAVFVEWANKIGTDCYPVSKKDYAFRKFKNKSIDFSLQTRYYGYIGVTVHTMARYQMENAALAVRALEILLKGDGLTAEQLQQGLSKTFWAGRMEEILPDVYVDGAHNEDGIRAFLESVSADECESRRQKRTLIFSVVADKDYESMIRQVLNGALFDRIFVTHMETKRAASLEVLRRLWKTEADSNVEVTFYNNVYAALQDAIARQNGDRIYVAGSLYLVGEIKEFFDHDQF